MSDEDAPETPAEPEDRKDPDLGEPAVESDAPDATAAAEPPGEEAPGEERRQRRASGAGALIGVLLVVLGFAIAAQVRSTNADTGLDNARPEDLVRILSGSTSICTA